MGQRIPIVDAKVMIKFINNLGFAEMRQKGSHKFFKHPDGRTATDPVHKGEDLGRGLTNKILKDVEINRKEFINWLNKKK